jgi:hypothetical protein
MPLARLENLLKNLNGNILYVDPAQLDSTDSTDNRGNSALRPFKTIQRALLEAVRFSYIQGANNDLFDQTTILISPGTHYIDNRPGFYVDGDTIKNYSGTTTVLPELTLQSIMDLDDPTNELYKYNSADGGVIVPRGVSIVSSDLRKTKIRPKYVPYPTDELIPSTSIFRLTGSCYIYGFSIFDGDPNGNVYNYPSSNFRTPPSYSHHKLTAFEYVDGKNKYVKNGVTLDKTDLEMYYYKVAKGFGQNTGIPVIIDWGVNTNPDLYPNVEENRIVGDLGFGTNIITNIYAGDGGLEISNIVTVTTTTDHNLSPNTAILISNVGNGSQQIAEYNGSFTVAQVINSTQFTYRLPSNPASTLTPQVNSDSKLTTVSDTVSSSSPYVFNCSLKSVYGMNGLHADGSKATGFRSIVTAQFTGISLQKDDNAFVIYNESSGTYNDQSAFEDEFLHQNSRARYKPDWESFHIKASNDAFIQCVSIFAIGYANHFSAQTGGDQSITNSNSNFGAISLSASGFKKYELPKDNHGFITHIIPPKEIDSQEVNVTCFELDSGKTSDVDLPTRVYLKGYNNELTVPPSTVKEFSIGGMVDDKIYINVDGNISNATVSPSYGFDLTISSIDSSTNTITLLNNQTVGSITGINTSQAVRVVSNNGQLPDGIDPHKVYYINTSLTTNTVQLSESISASEDEDNVIDINDIGSSNRNLRLVSKVSDRSPGTPGSPIQYDSANDGWYINIQSKQSFVDDVIAGGDPSFYITRSYDNRNLDDKIYRARYVIPKDSSINAAEPSVGFILQRSSSAISDLYTKLDTDLSSVSQARNTNQIVDAWYASDEANIITKNPHNLRVGDVVNIYNLKSSNEPSPVGLGTGTGYNGSFIVSNVVNELHFRYEIEINPGTITPTAETTRTNWLNVRDCNSSTYRVPPYTIEDDNNTRESLPYFSCEEITNEFQIYKVDTIQKYSYNVSDGVYYVTLNAFKNTPDVSPFDVDNLRLSQSIENLYPTTDFDNPVSDPYPTKTYASRKTIGKVDVNDLNYSVTKETTSAFLSKFGISYEVEQIENTGSTCVITTTVNHGLQGISALSISGGGSGFVNGTWSDIPLCGGTGENATATITVSGGSVTSATISHPGSGYTAGDVLTARGIPHSSSNSQSVNLTVSSVFSAVNKGIQIIGSKKVGNDGFFPIESVTPNTITYTNANGADESAQSFETYPSAIISNEALNVQSVSYNSADDISTITVTSSSSPHLFFAGDKVYFSGIVSDTFDVTSVNSATQFEVSGNASSQTGKVYLIPIAPSLSNSNKSNENLSSRQYPLISELQKRCSSSVGQNASSISVGNSRGLSKSDFIQIDEEIMMITKVNGSSLSVLRGLFNTKQTSHLDDSIVTRISPIPVELRRNSILRASGHTFEYTGFGPGNYSTGMPTNQDRVLTEDEILISQSLPTRGGSVLYTGMNSNGEFYIGRRKINALTGEEQFVGVPQSISQSNYSDELTVNNLTVTNNLDASSATTEFKDIQVNRDLNVGRNLTVGGTISGELQYSVSEGDGLTGGTFDNTSDKTIALGTPSSITSTSTNGVTANSHTHTLANGSVTTDKLDGTNGSEAVTSAKIRSGAVTSTKLNGGQTDTAPIFGARAWGKMINGKTSTPTVEYGGNVQVTVTKTSTGRYLFVMENKLQNNAQDTGVYSPDTGESTWSNQKFIVIANPGTDDEDHICSIDAAAGPGNGEFAIKTFDTRGNQVLADTDVIYFVVFG